MDQTVELSWETLRDVLAVAREGGIRSAAALRGVSHATLSRHLAELESVLDTPIFIRTGRGIALTEVGDEIATTLARVEEEINALYRRVSEHAFDVSGNVRVAALPSMLPLLAPALVQLRDAWPELCVELVTSVELSNITQRDADIAVRASAEPDEHLVGRRVGGLGKAVYKQRGLTLPEDPGSWPWIDWDFAYRHCGPTTWLAQAYPDARIVARVVSIEGLLQLVEGGVGVGVLPRPVGDHATGVVRCLEIDLPATPLWVLTHPDLRRVPRVRVVARALADQLSLVASPSSTL